MYCYKALIGTGIINSALETNMREATEFFSMYIGFSGVASVIVLIALIVGLYKYNPLKKNHFKTKDKIRYSMYFDGFKRVLYYKNVYCIYRFYLGR